MTSIFVFYIVCSWALHVLFLITQNDSSVLLLPCSSWGGQAVADAMVPDVEFSVVKIAACNLSSAGAPSTLSPGIRALQTITPKLKDALITEVQMEFPGGQDPNFSELGEWG